MSSVEDTDLSGLDVYKSYVVSQVVGSDLSSVHTIAELGSSRVLSFLTGREDGFSRLDGLRACPNYQNPVAIAEHVCAFPSFPVLIEKYIDLGRNHSNTMLRDQITSEIVQWLSLKAYSSDGIPKKLKDGKVLRPFYKGEADDYLECLEELENQDFAHFYAAMIESDSNRDWRREALIILEKARPLELRLLKKRGTANFFKVIEGEDGDNKAEFANIVFSVTHKDETLTAVTAGFLVQKTDFVDKNALMARIVESKAEQPCQKSKPPKGIHGANMILTRTHGF